MSKNNSVKVIELQTVEAAIAPAAAPERATLIAIEDDGNLRVRTADGGECSCDWLEAAAVVGPPLAAGDAVLVLPAAAGAKAVVLGRVGRYRAPAIEKHVAIEASETLTLKCGDASVDLRADGKVMVRGEDVLLRAKGTQRIRAGSVSIN